MYLVFILTVLYAVFFLLLTGPRASVVSLELRWSALRPPHPHYSLSARTLNVPPPTTFNQSYYRTSDWHVHRPISIIKRLLWQCLKPIWIQSKKYCPTVCPVEVHNANCFFFLLCFSASSWFFLCNYCMDLICMKQIIRYSKYTQAPLYNERFMQWKQSINNIK